MFCYKRKTAYEMRISDRSSDVCSSDLKKIKKTAADLAVALERTTDSLATVAASSPQPFVVGFAAETHELEHYARDKLQRKGLDLIAANQVGCAGAGFEADCNTLQVFWADGTQTLGPYSKTAVAQQ